ncbi:MAG: hypothetical protein ACC631_10660 [Halocynthiibacter sp.]
MPLTIDSYCNDKNAAIFFENQVLYKMCRDNNDHKSAYVTSGKVLAIGRIYAASPERGAGRIRPGGIPLLQAIGEKLSGSSLDGLLGDIDPSNWITDHGLLDAIVETHEFLVDAIKAATTAWPAEGRKEGWKPRNQGSFASKYLHFHRPNAFPIMDSFAKAGLKCVGQNGAFNTYEKFCKAFVLHACTQDKNWTPRSIDTELVRRGRIHKDTKPGETCTCCDYKKKGKIKKMT